MKFHISPTSSSPMRSLLCVVALLATCISAFKPQPGSRGSPVRQAAALRMSDSISTKTTDSRRSSALDNGETFTIAILGDLHLDPRTMQDHIDGRKHFIPIVTDKTGAPRPRTAVVSLGDLGESKAVKPDSKELFAGTTECFKLAREYLDGFNVRANDNKTRAIHT